MRRCSICDHSDCSAIDAEVVANVLSNRGIARKFGVSEDALSRHRDSGHIARKLVKAKQANEVAEATTLLQKLERLEARLTKALDRCEAAGDDAGLTKVAKELRELLRLAGELTGQLRSGAQVNVAVAVNAGPPQLTADELEHELQLGQELLEELRAAQSQPAPTVVTVAGHALPAVTAEGAKP